VIQVNLPDAALHRNAERLGYYSSQTSVLPMFCCEKKRGALAPFRTTSEVEGVAIALLVLLRLSWMTISLWALDADGPEAVRCRPEALERPPESVELVSWPASRVPIVDEGPQ
jgi:hypothetical protein